jgi:nickel-dependent lactate racemase
VDSLPLWQLSQGKQRVTIIASDHTRLVPSKLLMPALLGQIRRGNPQADITILIATGCHRDTTREELIDKFGSEIVENEKIVVHNCDDADNMRLLGTLPSGGPCWVNRLAVEADLLVSEGFIEPHFFAGYSGGRKAVLPGVAGRETVLANHCAEFIADPAARAGSLDSNPIHRDMVWAAEQTGLAFVLNVVLNSEKQVIHAVAGHAITAHRAGCAFLESLCGVKAAPADIVISTNGGYPLDQNIYQAVKGMTTAEATVNDGGVIIMLAKSNDGHGGEAFCRELAAGEDMDALMDAILRRPRNQTLPDQWQAQIMIRILQKARIIYISDASEDLVRSLHMTPAKSLQEALTLAESMLPEREPKVTVIPDGLGVIVL